MDGQQIEIPFGAENVIIETGKLAKQANAAVTVTLGGTTVLVAACMSSKAREGIDFFPLMVEYQEKAYAAGKIPGGFFKREGRPSQKETLTARIIDRPIRPLFPEGFYYEVVVTCNIISSDGENDPDTLALLGASAALHVSDIPFDGPIGVGRVCMIDGNYIFNPTYEQREASELELLVAGKSDGIVMIEGEGKEIPEDIIVNGLKFAHEQMQAQIEGQNAFQKQVGKEKAEVSLFAPHPDLKAKISKLSFDKLKEIYTTIEDKQERDNAQSALLDGLLSDVTVFDAYKQGEEEEVPSAHIRTLFDEVEYEVVRELVFKENKRADGRKCEEIRDLASEINVLPRTHGTGLFTRGQTQALGVITLGNKRDEQMVEGLQELTYSNFMLHYNFPAFSVGEARGSRGPGRREIGHGALAAKALKGVMPTKEEFPYTVRVVSEILESNGSSSMASVCAGCLGLMAAGVPLKNAVAGISIGLMLAEDNKDYRLLTDIMGLEDHHGDMDYKIAGSEKGITAIQLDIKVQGLPMNILEAGIQRAQEVRMGILKNMKACIAEPAADVNEYAPRILKTKVPQKRIGEVIGPGGKVIKKIMEDTGASSIDIDDDGNVVIMAVSKDAAEAAIAYVNGIVEEPEVGRIYDAKVVNIMNFGAFVEYLPGQQGLVHVSELSDEFVKDVHSVVAEGDEFKVKLVKIDDQGRVNLSKKAAEAEVS